MSLRFVIRRHWPWLVAGAVLCGSVWLFFLALPAQRENNTIVADKVQLLETQLQAHAAIAAASPQNLSTQLASFDSLSQVTADLQSLAMRNGLLMSDATFKPAADGEARTDIGRIEVSARAKGGYLPLKKTVATLLAAHPGLALESLSLRRARPTDIVADIDLRFTYFYRKPA
ncbi:hypothetical protein [Janthinobacterium sp. 1_2014MBL_MicDiv]|uniref:hypothetical protein n=1 Tax=Janthinobacterium sp. 1_2014MBL_MicDiv TaxID=1644131 RepID=UPI0008F4BE96|nr:hypothetical protein [Janthinobacterium sp. 1_2014MBL_MicDiv]APA68770.1 hypothetical protein YQ44_14235 [Janthinobacterium sp. 1_2014MBL_MicDiv]